MIVATATAAPAPAFAQLIPQASRPVSAKQAQAQLSKLEAAKYEVAKLEILTVRLRNRADQADAGTRAAYREANRLREDAVAQRAQAVASDAARARAEKSEADAIARLIAISEQIAKSDPAYAQAKSAFGSAVLSLAESDDPQIQALLAAYADGDPKALVRLRGAIRQYASDSPDRAQAQAYLRGLAQLTTDAAAKGRATKGEAIAAWEDVLKSSPSDDDALWYLVSAYREQGDAAKASRIADRLYAAVPAGTALQPLALYMKGNAALAGGEPRRAAEIYREVISIGRQVYTLRTDSLETLQWERFNLSQLMRPLAELSADLGDFAGAREAIGEALGLRMQILEDDIRAGASEKTVKRRWIELSDYLSIAGGIELKAGAYAEAAKVLHAAMDARRNGTSDTASPPFYELIPLARAEVALGELDAADAHLAAARASLDAELKSEPGRDFLLRSQARLFETSADLAAARGHSDQARTLLASALAKYDATTPDWYDAEDRRRSAEVAARLAKLAS